MLVFAFAMISLYYHKTCTVLEPQVNICLHHTSQDKYTVACTFNSISSQETWNIRSWRSQTHDENVKIQISMLNKDLQNEESEIATWNRIKRYTYAV